MKASELITRLQELQNEHGDADIFFHDASGYCGYGYDSIERVEFLNENLGHDSKGYDAFGIVLYNV